MKAKVHEDYDDRRWLCGTGHRNVLRRQRHDVTCLDIDEAKVLRLRNGEIPIYEPGLTELVKRNVSVGRLTFTTEVEEAIASADVVFLAVGTPSGADSWQICAATGM